VSLVPTILLILAAVSIGAVVIAAVVSLRSGREARSTLFPIIREEEAARSRRARVAVFFLAALTALFLGGWMATLRLADFNNPAVSSGDMPDPVVVAVPTDAPTDIPPISPETGPAQPGTAPVAAPAQALPTEVPAALSLAAPAQAAESEPFPVAEPLTFTPVVELMTPSPTATATPVPPSPTPTATPSPIPPTATPTLPASVAYFPTSAARTPAPPEAKIGPIQFASGITEDVKAVNPDRRFPADVKSIYAIYPYSGMQKGLNFTVVWYQNGVEVSRGSEEWQWGPRASSYSYLNPRGEGLYKVELYINDSVLATGMFEIR
jgi:hypothetical protein